VLNVHWTTPVLGAARNAVRARAKVALIGDLLDAFQEAGGRLVWTVPTLLPDDPVHLESELALAGLLADRAGDGAAGARASAERAARSLPVREMAARFADAVAPLLSFTQT
jgi:hypothetical protein